MEKVKLAFVGCGAITRNKHLPAALRSPLVDVAALVDSRIENARSVADMYGVEPTLTTSMADVPDDVEAFVVATPNDTHYPIVKDILSHGKPVLVEKPITTSYRHAVELCELAERMGTFIAVGYWYRFFSSVQLFGRLLADGFFGPVLGFSCEMGSRGGWAPVSGYNIDRSRSGGGVLVVNGTHLLDLALCWFGEPVSFRYEDDNYGNVEANCKGVLTFDTEDGSFDGKFFFSKTIDLSNCFRIDTEKYRVEWSPKSSESLAVFDKRHSHIRMDLSRVQRDREPPDYFQIQLEHFCRCVRKIEAPLNDGRSAAKSVKLTEDMYANSTRLTEGWLTYKSSNGQKAEPKPRIGILGASGFVGSALVERLFFDGLYRDKFEFTAFIHSYGNAARVTRLPIKIEAIDLLDYHHVEASLRGCDFVVNCTRGDSTLMIRGLKNVTRALKELHTKKFVHLGSVAIYGDDPPPESSSENAPPNPKRTPYGNIKVAQDEIVFQLHASGVPSVVLCPSNIGGPYSSFIVDTVAKLLTGEIALVDEGRYPTNIVHVDNLVQAILAAVESDTGLGEMYFVNEPQPTSWKEFLADMAALAGIDYEFPKVSREEVLQHLMGRDAGRSAGVKRQLGVLVSKEFRDAMGRIRVFKKMDDAAVGMFTRLNPGAQEKLRRKLRGPVIISEARRGPGLGHKLITAQIRRVYHSPDKIMKRLNYRPLLDYRKGMDTTRKWLEFSNLVPAQIPSPRSRR